jgi:ribosomal protein L35AE/L33A
VESDENETPLVQISHDESHQGRIQTLTLYFNYSDPANGHLITGLINALHGVNILAITNLRLGGVVNASVLEALPPQWLSSVTRLGLELTNLNPSQYS